MKNIKVKQTINTGNYENIVIEIDVDRPAAMTLLTFLIMAKHQLDEAIKEFTTK